MTEERGIERLRAALEAYRAAVAERDAADEEGIRLDHRGVDILSTAAAEIRIRRQMAASAVYRAGPALADAGLAELPALLGRLERAEAVADAATRVVAMWRAGNFLDEEWRREEEKRWIPPFLDAVAAYDAGKGGTS